MKHGGYKSEFERQLLEPRDSGPNEALDDFELSLDIEPNEVASATREALVIIKENGEWPEWALNLVLSAFSRVAYRDHVEHPSDLFDALYDAAQIATDGTA